MPRDEDSAPGLIAHVFRAADLCVASGVNHGDTAAEAEIAEPGDIYRLSPDAIPLRMILRAAPDGTHSVAGGSEIGRPGDGVTAVTLMSFFAPDGDGLDVLVLDHREAGRFVLPLTPMVPKRDYALIALRADPEVRRLNDIVCTSFAAGTLITMDGGLQRPVETLRPGDLVLTRAHGAQPIRWVGRATLRAVGAFAPVVISAGTLGNGGDLVVGPHHRVFIYQRGPRRLGDAAEILVQAKHLVDDDAVRRREGGFVDYLSLVFDRHEIIYAEGIPAESLLVNEATVRLLPDALADDLRAVFPGLRHRQHFGTEVGRLTLEEEGREALFRFPKKP